MRNLYDIDPGGECPHVVRMIVEIPKNSSNKIEYDHELDVFRLDRTLYSPLHYPGDYGFVPGTLSEDGDPLDVISLVSEPSFSGCMMDVRPVGALDMVDQSKPDFKLLAVPEGDPRFEQVQSMDQVEKHVRREIEHFFTIYKELEGKQTRIKGWKSRDEVRKLIVACREAYLKRGGRKTQA